MKLIVNEQTCKHAVSNNTVVSIFVFDIQIPISVVEINIFRYQF